MSLVGFSAQNHPQQRTKDDVDDRRTLPALYEPIFATLRPTIDAAASVENALLPRFWTVEDDALVQDWRDERVWCNPPYPRLFEFVRKAFESTRDGCPIATLLLPANRCEQRWWQEHVEPFRDGRGAGPVAVTTEFLLGRRRFGHPAGWFTPEKGDRPPFGLVIVTFQPAPDAPHR